MPYEATAVFCNVCDKAYNSWAEAERCEYEHRIEQEEDDPPAVGDCPNDYAWNEHDEGKARIIMRGTK